MPLLDGRIKQTRRAALIAISLLLFDLLPAVAMSTEERCAYRFTRMASAQTSRVIEEVAKCVRRNPSTFATRCIPRVDGAGDLDTPDKILAKALERVERHGNEKFPRKCAGVRTDFFEPACHDIEDTSHQLRRCLYNDHTLPFVEVILERVDELTDDGACARQVLNQLRIVWREWVELAAEEADRRMIRTFNRAVVRVSGKCPDGDVAELMTDAFLLLQAHTADIRRVVPFDRRR